MTPLSWHSYAGKAPSLNATVRIVHVVWGHGVTMRVELSFLLAYAASRRHTNGLREHRLCSVDMALVQEFGQLQESTKVKNVVRQEWPQWERRIVGGDCARGIVMVRAK